MKMMHVSINIIIIDGISEAVIKILLTVFVFLDYIILNSLKQPDLV